jgi:hypothetical protein
MVLAGFQQLQQIGLEGEWPVRMEIFLVGCDPVGCDVALRGGQVDFTCTDHFVKTFFQGASESWKKLCRYPALR